MKSRFQNWSDVRVVLAVVLAGSTLAASKDLNMTQPTVARRIAALEHALGVTLFASRSYAAKHPLPATERDFKGHRFIVFDAATFPTQINDCLLPRIDPSQVVMTCTDMKSLETAVRMGSGIGGLPSSYGARNDNFVACFERPPETGTYSWLLVNPTAYRRPGVKAFAAFFAPATPPCFTADHRCLLAIRATM